MDKSNERWLPIAGYENFYEVSDLGRVRSLRRKTGSGWRGGRVLKGRPHPKSGHLQVQLSVANVAKHKYVHVLVARAFIGECPPGQEVRHLDGNPGNNAVENLTYGTRSENNLDAVRHGTHSNAAKTRCKYGHEFTPQNTVRLSGGRRRNCRTCARRLAREVAERKRLRRKAA
jgi:HNH endonuclease/NUMOD4 motif